jgi:hypothetical protein
MKETLEIAGGGLGPVPPCTLALRPFSVFIGPQGSGKSLVAQVLYFFRAMEGHAAEAAIFVPTERLFYSQVRSPLAPRLMALPLTHMLFSAWMQRAAETIDAWKDGPDTSPGRLVAELAREALGGEAYRRGKLWKWRFRSGRRQRTLDLDMASSGQRATAPLVLLAETLLSLRRRRRIDPGFTIYVEEPEIHLHPDAQVAIVEVLALMVRAGFRIVLTTHSLTILYALNNLVLAGDLPRQTTRDVPRSTCAYPRTTSPRSPSGKAPLRISWTAKPASSTSGRSGGSPRG